MADDTRPVGLNSDLLKPLKNGLRSLSILYSSSVELVTGFENSLPKNAVHIEDPNLREIKIVLEALGARIYELNKISVSSDTQELRRGIRMLTESLDLQRRKTCIHHLITAEEHSSLAARIELEQLPNYLDGLFRKLQPNLRLKQKMNS